MNKLNKENTFDSEDLKEIVDIENLYDKQIRDLTRRTVRGNNLKTKIRHANLENFKFGQFLYKNKGKKVHRNIFTKKYPEDYFYDGELEEWINRFPKSK
jgi:hypothetical protein